MPSITNNNQHDSITEQEANLSDLAEEEHRPTRNAFPRWIFVAAVCVILAAIGLGVVLHRAVVNTPVPTISSHCLGRIAATEDVHTFTIDPSQIPSFYDPQGVTFSLELRDVQYKNNNTVEGNAATYRLTVRDDQRILASYPRQIGTKCNWHRPWAGYELVRVVLQDKNEPSDQPDRPQSIQIDFSWTSTPPFDNTRLWWSQPETLYPLE